MSGESNVVNYDESVVSEIQGNDFALTIVASAFSNEIYTNNYIKNLFDALDQSIENCVTTINQANIYFEKLAESEGIEQPELIDLSFMMVGNVVDVTANAQVVTQNANGNLNIHSNSQSINSNVTESISNGTSVKVIGEENGMYKIEYGDGKIGYVSKDYIKINEDVNLNNESLTPDVSGEKDCTVPVSATSSTTSQAMSEVTSETSESFESYKGKVNLNNDDSHLNFRSGPSKNDSIIASLDQGTEINVVGQSEDGKWLKVEYGDNKTGWVSSEYVSNNSKTTVDASNVAQTASTIMTNTSSSGTNTSTFESYTAKVNLNNRDSHLNFRSGPSMNDSIIGSLDHGSEINIIGESSDGKWVKVNFGGQVGYVSKSKISTNN